MYYLLFTLLLLLLIYNKLLKNELFTVWLIVLFQILFKCYLFFWIFLLRNINEVSKMFEAQFQLLVKTRELYYTLP